MLAMRTGDSIYWTYDRLLTRFDVSGRSAFVHAFVRNASAQFREPGISRVHDAFFSQIDFFRFRATALERRNNPDCVSVHDAITRAASIRRDYPSMTAHLLIASQLRRHDDLEAVPESNRLLAHGVSEPCRLKIYLPEYLETAQHWF
jgi:hypothetical protein